MVSGQLSIKVHKIEITAPDDVYKSTTHCVKFAIGPHDHRTKYRSHEQVYEQTLHFELKSVEEDIPIFIEVNAENSKKPLVANKLGLKGFLHEELSERKITLTSGPKLSPTTVHVYLSSEWKPTPSALTYDTHRPWFTRISYYYDTTKRVYTYTTSFPVVNKVARFGENTTNAVLHKVSGKTLHDLDQDLLVPVLDTIDNKVDATLSTVITKLGEGQQYVLQTKDVVVDKASTVVKKSTETITGVVGTTYGGVVKVKDYTQTKVVNASSSVYGAVAGATSSVYGTVSNVTGYATTQVVNASSSTYGKVSGATVYVLSHVPVVGPKLVAA